MHRYSNVPCTHRTPVHRRIKKNKRSTAMPPWKCATSNGEAIIFRIVRNIESRQICIKWLCVWQMLSDKILNLKGSACNGEKVSRVPSVSHTVPMDVSCKLRPFVIGKSRSPLRFKDGKGLQDPMSSQNEFDPTLHLDRSLHCIMNLRKPPLWHRRARLVIGRVADPHRTRCICALTVTLE